MEFTKLSPEDYWKLVSGGYTPQRHCFLIMDDDTQHWGYPMATYKSFDNPKQGGSYGDKKIKWVLIETHEYSLEVDRQKAELENQTPKQMVFTLAEIHTANTKLNYKDDFMKAATEAFNEIAPLMDDDVQYTYSTRMWQIHRLASYNIVAVYSEYVGNPVIEQVVETMIFKLTK